MSNEGMLRNNERKHEECNGLCNGKEREGGGGQVGERDRQWKHEKSAAADANTFHTTRDVAT